MSTRNYLSEMVAHKRAEIEALPDLDPKTLRPSDRQFAAALDVQGVAVIAELKRCSPHEGLLCREYEPGARAQDCELGGAAALSVLTEPRFYGGWPAHLVEARLSTRLPVLRRDLIIDARQVTQSRRMGADACLLVAAVLDSGEFDTLRKLIEDLGMTAVAEVHTERELEMVLSAGARLIMINNRNLETMACDLGTTHRLCPMIPDALRVISASGIKSPQDLGDLPPRVDAVLIGTALMRCEDPIGFIQQALGLEPVA